MLAKYFPEDQLDEPISLEESCKVFPGRPTIYTVRRHARKGIRGGIKLKSFRSGGRLYTTRRWCRDFIAAQNDDPTTPRRQASAESELASMGV